MSEIFDSYMVKKMFGEKNPFIETESGEKIDLKYTQDEILEILYENDILLKQNNFLRRENERLRAFWRKSYRTYAHVYKIEMERLRKKLTRIYAYYEEMWGNADVLRKL